MIKRLTYIHDAPIPSSAANAVQVTKMCEAFQLEGAEVTLVAPFNGFRGCSFRHLAGIYGLSERFRLLRFPILPLPGRALSFGAAGLMMSRLSGRSIAYTRSIAVGHVATRLGVPTVLELHHPVSDFRPVLRGRLQKLSNSRNFLLAVVISDRLKKDYEHTLPQLTGRIMTAHDGADAVADSGDRPLVKLTGGFKVGYVGRTYPGKGLEILQELGALCPWATFHIVGGLPAENKSFRCEFQQLDNVVFHDYMPHSETSAILAAMDVLIAPYQQIVRPVGGGDINIADWMSPLKIFEYMAHGKAIIASDLPVLREILKSEENAILCEPENAAAWAKVLDRLRGDPALRQKLGRTALDCFIEKYTWRQRAEKIVGMIEKRIMQSENISNAKYK